MVEYYYSLNYLYQSFNNDSEEVFDMVDIYLSTIPDIIKKLNLANSNNDIESEKRIAHKLKTTFTLFEINEAVDIARSIESGELSSKERKNCLDRLNKIINNTFKDLKKEKDNYLKNNNKEKQNRM